MYSGLRKGRRKSLTLKIYLKEDETWKEFYGEIIGEGVYFFEKKFTSANIGKEMSLLYGIQPPIFRNIMSFLKIYLRLKKLKKWLSIYILIVLVVLMILRDILTRDIMTLYVLIGLKLIYLT